MNKDSRNLPIGVFDSGVGGLTVVRALMNRLPDENIVYFGDTARVPYGVKSVDTIRLYASEIVDFLLGKKVKAFVIACNSIAAVAGHEVRAQVPDYPVFDVISAGSKAAARTTKNGKVGVIATMATVNSKAYTRMISERNPEIEVISKACPLLVPLVEEGWFEDEITRLTVRKYLKDVLAKNIDTLVLGCTHYPLIQKVLQEEARGCELVDSAITTAEDTAIELEKLDLLNDGTGVKGDYSFFVSDIPARFKEIGENFLGREFNHLDLVKLGYDKD